MSMQDNEFDDLFRAKLDGLEMEPSAQVWDNIDTKLNGKKRRAVLLPWLSVAASIVVLITAGILFIPKKEDTGNKAHNKNQLANNAVKPTVTKSEEEAPISVQATKTEQVAIVHTPASQVFTVPTHKKRNVSITTKLQDVAPVMAKATPAKMDEQPVLTAVVKPDVIKSVVPDTETPLATKQVVAGITNNDQQQPVLAAVQLPAAIDKPVKQPAKRHGIHNMGDLVNLVMAKVDKRKDKAIQFSDGEEESTITGVHIGAIDIKKEAK